VRGAVAPAASRRRDPTRGRRPLPARFYDRPVLEVARALLGRALIHDLPGGRRAGLIVEVEAYRGADDPASHAFRGRTERNAVMFGPAGRAYVYFIYGMHHCLNVVTGRPGAAAAVLIRAIEPVEGIESMRRSRAVKAWEQLGRGPGCVTSALGLDRRHNGADLTRGPLWLGDGRPLRGGRRVVAGPRIGIRLATGRRWRFHLAGHPCVSGPATGRRRSGSAPGRVRR